MTRIQRAVSWTGAIAAVAVLGGRALATPGSGVVSSAVKATASFADPTDIKLKVESASQEIIHVASARETYIQEIVISPGGHTGWHSHPGPVIVLVKAGALAFYDGEDVGCTARTYQSGQAFVDRGQGHVHIARNMGTTNLELWAVYFDVPAGGPFRIDVPDPGNCAF